jgi:Fe-S-cluster containining protein
MEKVNNNEILSICSMCKGKCCKRMPGTIHPDQIKDISVESLSALIKTKNYAFDYWEGNPSDNTSFDGVTAYYLRPATKGAIGRIVDASWGGECAFLTDTGCSLSFDDRPLECQELVVDKDFNCTGEGFSKKESSIAWLEYNTIIEETIESLYK